MAYAEAGKRPPRGDLYIIDGFDRALVKLAVNTLFNAPTRKGAVGGIAEGLHKDVGLSWSECYTQAKKVVAAIRRKHRQTGGVRGMMNIPPVATSAMTASG
jgi:hypothetical protein